MLKDSPRHGIVCEEKPEAEDWLGQDVKNGVGDDLGINVDVAGSIGNTPDTGIVSMIRVTTNGPLTQGRRSIG